MRKIKIKRYRRKSYVKDVIPGRGVRRKRVSGTIVGTHYTPDKGKRGRTPKSQRWFSPEKNLHGWKKELPTIRRRRLAGIGRNDLSSARALQQLANVTSDRETRKIAKTDADYFFKKHKSR